MLRSLSRNAGTVSTWALAAILMAVAPARGFSDADVPDNTQSSIGVNFWFFNDYQRIWPFVNFFKTAREFWAQGVSGTYPWKLDTQLDLDQHGYPRSLPDGVAATTLLFWGDDGMHPTGNYTVLWDGDGDCTIDPYGIGTIVETGQNRLVVDVPRASENTNAKGLVFKITRTNPGDPVRNIRFIAPGFEDTYAQQVFHPQFLKRLRPFRVLRFMDWMAANEKHDGTWEARNTPASATYQLNGEGVSLEHMIQLANRLHADPWFCLPANADDTYFRNFAQMVKDSLDPSLKAYFEYANEVWNGMFYGADYCQTMGTQLGLGSGWEAQYKYWSKRMKELFVIVEDVYGDELSTRAVRVAATQFGNTGVSTSILDYDNAYEHCDVLAIAPYINKGRASLDESSILAALAERVEMFKSMFANHVEIAHSHGLELAWYEGGLDLFGVADNAFILPIRRNPEIKTIYLDLFRNFKDAGGQVMCHYTFCNHVWGLVEHMEQPLDSAYQYQAACEFISANPQWWQEERVGILRPSTPGHIARLHGPNATCRVFSLSGRMAPHVFLSGDQTVAAAGTYVFYPADGDGAGGRARFVLRR